MDARRPRLLHEEPLIGPDCPGGLAIHAQEAKAAYYRGKQCLRVENGLVTLTNPRLAALSSGRIEVDIAVEGPAYPGVAFRIADRFNYELMYSQPHSSDQWDALQYDPVFHGSNTWQIYHGPKFQKAAVIPTGEWYTLVVEFGGWAASIHLPGQESLTVEGLAMPQSAGGIGVWTYLPAYFCNMRVYAGEPGSETATPRTSEWPEAARVSDTATLDATASDTAASGTRSAGTSASGASSHGMAVDKTDAGRRPDEPRTTVKARSQSLPPGTITAWLAEGYGVVHCEPHGILNLNRYFPLSLGEVTLTRRFTLHSESKVTMNFGLSDDLTLSIDGLPLYTSTKPFRPTAGAEGRGYIKFDTCKMSRSLCSGTHVLSVKLRVAEPFGWGLALSLTGDGLALLPPGL